MNYRYYLQHQAGTNAGQWYEVTLDEFKAAERRNGFHGGDEDSAATAGFGGPYDAGRVEFVAGAQ